MIKANSGLQKGKRAQHKIRMLEASIVSPRMALNPRLAPDGLSVQRVGGILDCEKETLNLHLRDLAYSRLASYCKA